MAKKRTLRSMVSGAASDFRSFAFKDDIFTLAIGVVIGTAFKDLIDSLVRNVFTPPIGFLTSRLDFSNLFFVLGDESYATLAEAEAAEAVVVRYGAFLNALISFLITALVVYIFIYRINLGIKRAVTREEKKVERNTRKCPYCLSEISNKASRCPFCTSTVKPILKEEK